MNRRNVLTLIGGIVGGSTGCLGLSGDSDGTGGRPTDEQPRDGYPPQFTATPDKRSIDTSAFATNTVDGVDVPLAPIEVAYYWYKRRAARFVDARAAKQYERSHIFGAVVSPAPKGGRSDPVESWPLGDRIVCYCGCPHHLSSLRAANLIAGGYGRVYVIDEGFWAWHDRGYPMAGTNIESQPAVQFIRGRTAAAYAGRTAWAWHEPTGQQEATAIAENGSYTFELRFSEVTTASMITIETPGYRIRAPLHRLTTDVVTAADERDISGTTRQRHATHDR